MQPSTDLTIYTVAELKPLLIAEVRDREQPELDLAAVAEVDGAGVQLILLAIKEAAKAGRHLRLAGCVPAVRETLELVGIAPAEEPVA